MGDSDTAPINNTDSNAFCREDEAFFCTFIYLLSAFPLYSSRFLSKAECKCCHMLWCPDVRTCLQEQVILQALPRAALRGKPHSLLSSMGHSTTTCGRRDTSEPCLGKPESWTVPLQTCVPSKSKGIYTLLTQCCGSKAFLLPPSWPLTPAPACPQPTHVVFP